VSVNRTHHRLKVGVVAAYDCNHSENTDVTAGFINKFGHLILDVRTTPGDTADNGGGAIDGVDGIVFNKLEFDYKGACDGTFIITYYAPNAPLGIDISCAQATISPAPNGFVHLVFTPETFNVAAGSVTNGFTLAKFVNANNSVETQITNVKLNSEAIYPTSTQAGCQF